MIVEKYDVALSFAGEERDLASTLAHALQEKGVSVFFDEFEKFAAASIYGVAKASKTLQKSGKTSLLSALGAALTVLVLGVLISDNATSIIATLFWIVFGLGLVYPHIIEIGSKAREKEIQSFITGIFGA